MDDPKEQPISETEIFLGSNPSKPKAANLQLRHDLVDKIKIWIKNGLTDKTEKKNLLESIPTKGQLNLQAQSLNEEMVMDLHSKAIAKDEYFKEYQNLAGATLSLIASVLSMILNDAEVPLDRNILLTNLANAVKLESELFYVLTQARKLFLIVRYEEKIQKALKNVEPTEFLFGENLKGLIENTKALEKVSKDLKPKIKLPFRSNELNWKGSALKRR